MVKINELTIKNNTLPNKLEDLAKFVLVGREKLTSVRAEIRAINKLELAEEVREQKKEEAQMLAEALIDAEVRIGDLLKQIPKNSGGDRKSYNFKNDSSVNFEKQKTTKGQIINKLGFNQKQAERFEMLANNKDLVEQVKAEARENDDIPTRTEVLRLAQMKKEQEKRVEDYDCLCKQLDLEEKVFNQYNDGIYGILTLEVNDENVKYWLKDQLPDNRRNMIDNIDKAIEKLRDIKNYAHDFNIIKVVK